MTGLVLAGAMSTYSRPSASTLAAYDADPSLTRLQLDLDSGLESAVSLLIADALARSEAR